LDYQRPFLESYLPNETHYLSEPARRKLFEIGSQTGMEAEPAGTYARHICQRLLIDLSWNSSRLEGNTYSLLETEQLFQADRNADAQLSTEAVMILNHKAAIEFLLESTTEAGFDRRTILNLHALLTADSRSGRCPAHGAGGHWQILLSAACHPRIDRDTF